VIRRIAVFRARMNQDALCCIGIVILFAAREGEAVEVGYEWPSAEDGISTPGDPSSKHSSSEAF
jgi:hypothetical protein